MRQTQEPHPPQTRRWIDTERVTASEGCSPLDGAVRISGFKTLWFFGMTIGGVAAVALFPSLVNAAVFLTLTALTLCLGHSVGMHRLLIHRSFETPLWLERALVYLGVLVGMAGPFGMIRLHDMRDWSQRQSDCHGYARHAAPFWADAWLQLCCRLDLAHPPQFQLEPRVREDRFYRLVEATWMAQQLPLAAALYLVGGVGMALWGVCLRVSLSLFGHWMVGHFAHTRGARPYGATTPAVDGFNVTGFGLISFGEAHHNNHHAYPRSAKLGHRAGEWDLGWSAIRALERVRLAWNLMTPERIDRASASQISPGP